MRDPDEDDSARLGVDEPDEEAGVPMIGLLFDKMPVLVRVREGMPGGAGESCGAGDIIKSIDKRNNTINLYSRDRC